MAYKRKSKKTGHGTRRTTTINTNKGITQSHSRGAGNYRRTVTQHGATTKVTEIIRRSDGYVTRKQKTVAGKSKKPKNPFGPKSKKNSLNKAFTSIFIALMAVTAILNYLSNLIFGG